MWIKHFYTLHFQEEQLLLALWQKRGARYRLLMKEAVDTPNQPIQQAILTLLLRIKLHSYPLILAVDDDYCVIKQLQFNATWKMPAILSQLNHEAQRYFGSQSDELNIDAEILSAMKTADSFVQVRAVAMRKQQLQALLELFQQYELKVHLVCPASLALERAVKEFLKQNHKEKKEFVGVVNVQPRSLIFYVMTNYFIYSRKEYFIANEPIFYCLDRQWRLCLSSLSLPTFNHLVLTGGSDQITAVLQSQEFMSNAKIFLASPCNF